MVMALYRKQHCSDYFWWSSVKKDHHHRAQNYDLPDRLGLLARQFGLNLPHRLGLNLPNRLGLNLPRPMYFTHSLSSSHDSSFSDIISCSPPPPPPSHLCFVLSISSSSSAPSAPCFLRLTLVHGDSHSGKTQVERKKSQFWTRSAPTPLTSVWPSYHHPAPSRQLSWKWTLPSWIKRALRLAFELMVHAQIQNPKCGFEFFIFFADDWMVSLQNIWHDFDFHSFIWFCKEFGTCQSSWGMWSMGC